MTTLLTIGEIFARLSLLAVGGVNSTVPEIFREVVTERHWMSPAVFAQNFAIANAAPGPNCLIVTMIGAQLAGIPGGLVATFAMVLPSGVCAIFVSGLWEKFRAARWRRIIQAALLPLTAGLVLAAGAVLVEQADTGWVTILVTVAAVLLCWRTRIHPLWVLGAGTITGLVLG